MNRFLVLISVFVVFLAVGQVMAQSEWKSGVFGDDWATEQATLNKLIPALEKGEGIEATIGDAQFLNAMPPARLASVTAAITGYYTLMESVTKGYGTRKFSLRAAREVGGYILLWVNEPEIMDGGRSLVYSIAKDRIIGDFWDGGYRG